MRTVRPMESGYGYDEPKHPIPHHCTDIPCCMIFLLVLITFFVLRIWVAINGEMGKLYHGIDYDGNICGVSDSVSDKPYLYWCGEFTGTTLSSVDLNNPVCVGSCPTTGTVSECDSVTTSGVSHTAYTTTETFHRYCLPDPAQYASVAESITDGPLSDWTTAAFEGWSSIWAAWPALLVTFLIAIGLGFLYLFILRFVSEGCIWLSMIAGIIVLVVLGIILFATSDHISSADKFGSLGSHAGLAVKLFGVVMIGGAVLLAFMLFCWAKSIKVAAACIEVASDALLDMPVLLLAPLLKAIMKVAVWIWLVFGFLELLSTADVSSGGGSSGVYRTFEFQPWHWCFFLFYLFCSFWILSYLTAVYQFAVGYAVADYYYAPRSPRGDKEKEVHCCAVFVGYYVGIIFHTGSMAMGAAIVAVIEVIEKLLELAKKMERETTNNCCIQCLICCCICCVQRCQDCVEFINKNIYVDLAINSFDANSDSGFCTSIGHVMSVMRNVGGAVAILSGTMWLFTIMGNLLITATCASLCYLILQFDCFKDDTTDFYVEQPLAPTVVAAILAFLVSTTFMDVFDMTSDGLIYIYGWDTLNGSNAPTAPEPLRKLVTDVQYFAGSGARSPYEAE